MEVKFSFRDLKLVESHFKLNTEFEFKRKTPVEITTEIDVSYHGKNGFVNVTMSIDSVNETQPFIFNLKILGVFGFSRLPSKEELDRIVNINCAAIIFPYAREIVGDLTRRASLPPFHMDPLNFVALYERTKSLPPQRPRIKRIRKKEVKSSKVEEIGKKE
jgi:preprotein translocase subunit SecB